MVQRKTYRLVGKIKVIAPREVKAPLRLCIQLETFVNRKMDGHKLKKISLFYFLYILVMSEPESMTEI